MTLMSTLIREIRQYLNGCVGPLFGFRSNKIVAIFMFAAFLEFCFISVKSLLNGAKIDQVFMDLSREQSGPGALLSRMSLRAV